MTIDNLNRTARWVCSKCHNPRCKSLRCETELFTGKCEICGNVDDFVRFCPHGGDHLIDPKPPKELKRESEGNKNGNTVES